MAAPPGGRGGADCPPTAEQGSNTNVFAPALISCAGPLADAGGLQQGGLQRWASLPNFLNRYRYFRYFV